MVKLAAAALATLVLAAAAGATNSTTLHGRAYISDGSRAASMTLLFFGAGGEYANIRTGNHGTYSVALPRDTYHVYALAPCPIPGCWPARWRVAESPVAVLGGETIRQTLTIIDPTMKGALNG